MPIISSRYWNMVHGATPDDVIQDEEGMQIMRILGKNMAYYLKCVEAADENVLNGDNVDISKVSAISFDPYTHGYYKVEERVGNAFKDGLELK